MTFFSVNIMMGFCNFRVFHHLDRHPLPLLVHVHHHEAVLFENLFKQLLRFFFICNLFHAYLYNKDAEIFQRLRLV